MKKTTAVIFLLCFATATISAQVERESRAVWVTTNFQLDWPPNTYNIEEQKAALRSIVADVKRKKLNTIYFQVRSNGTTMYRSNYEPISSYLTGQTGRDPGYDPLEYMIDLAHGNGIELHAWVNVMRCFSSNSNNKISHPDHLNNKHPDWIYEVRENGTVSYWVDPGLPEVRDYLVDLFLDLVYNYNIDGLHLDFIRYPSRMYNDDFSYNLYGNGTDRDQWRRDNITKFVEALHLNVKEVKPLVKIGATPIGIYRNLKLATGLQGYSEVFQDSREWLNRGYIDYVVPQIYWSNLSNPKYEALVEDWRNSNPDKNLIIGIAAYKEEVVSELHQQVEIARKKNADGVAFFRYEHIKNLPMDFFTAKAFPAALPNIIAAKPEPPYNLSYYINDSNQSMINLSWKLDDEYFGNGAEYLALYKLDDPTENLKPENLQDVFSADKTKISIVIEKPKQVNYYFTLKSVDKLWNESDSTSNIVEVTIPALEDIAKQISYFDKPVLVKSSDNSYKLLLYSKITEQVYVIAGKGENKAQLIVDKIYPGKNIFSFKQNLVEFEYLEVVYTDSGNEIRLTL